MNRWTANGRLGESRCNARSGFALAPLGSGDHKLNIKDVKYVERAPASISCRTAKQSKANSASATQRPELASGSKLFGTFTSLALTGATAGTFLDGIHTRVQLLVYDSQPLTLGGLHTSAWIPPLLASFYVILGGLVLLADQRMAAGGDKTTQHAVQHISLARMALSVGVLASMLELSSLLYSGGAESSSICVVLALCAFTNYLLFDSTKQGLALSLLCALACPAAELALMSTLGLWHYPLGDLAASVAGGIPKWVPFCYFFYVPWVANLSRYLYKMM